MYRTLTSEIIYSGVVVPSQYRGGSSTTARRLALDGDGLIALAAAPRRPRIMTTRTRHADWYFTIVIFNHLVTSSISESDNQRF